MIPDMAGTLFVVGTPIGNLDDLAPRAARTLGSVAAVAAEDTRRTRGLLTYLGVRTRLLALPAEAERERAEAVLKVLRDGGDVALVTDAGMPGVSDPGQHLIARAAEEGIPVVVLPGPSAVTSALVASGLPAERWAFEGFLPRKGRARADRLAAVAADARTTVIFESPRRTAATLDELAGACGADRPAAVARELTKLHEEVARGSLGDLARDFGGREEVRGEIAIVVGGASGAEPGPPPGDDELAGEAAALVAEGYKPREASAEVARRHRIPANDVYRALMRARGTDRS